MKKKRTQDLFCINTTQNELLVESLLAYYANTSVSMDRMVSIINGESNLSLRLIDWFVTNYSKKHFVVYALANQDDRFKVYNDYKLKLKSYSKRRFDPFCRWERMVIPYKEDKMVETTLGQLNFFKWAIENGILDYMEAHLKEIESDMNMNNSSSRRRDDGVVGEKTRHRREELSVSACKCIKSEHVQITVKFS